MLIAQDRMVVEHFTRQADGAWLREVRAGLLLRLPCCAIAIEALYRRVLR